MSMKWFRFYSEFMDDPKIAMMSDSDQLLWVKALCLASESQQRGSILLSDEEICWKLRISLEIWRHAVDKFRAKGMIEHCKGGYKITNWNKRQFESDDVNKRVAKSRSSKKSEGTKQECNVTSNVTRNRNVTPPDTDTESDPDYRSRSRTEPDQKLTVDPDPVYDPESNSDEFEHTHEIAPEKIFVEPLDFDQRVSGSQLTNAKVVSKNETSKPKDNSGGTSSGAARGDKQKFLAEFQERYNAHKARNWKASRKLSPDQTREILKLAEDVGREEALKMCELACAEFAANKFWADPAKTNFSIMTLFHKDRIYDYAERNDYQSAGYNDPEQIKVMETIANNPYLKACYEQELAIKAAS